ncbi:MAG: shikimate dehydrogenase [Bacillota bacterium]
MKKWYAVIGDPISHSLSPFMHDHWFQKHDIDASYIPFHIEPNQLEASLQAMKLLGISGFNITLPHKQAVIPLLDELDETAQNMNAVNTVVADNGHFKGSNTDGEGFVRSLMSYPVNKEGSVLVVGAGGAARGIAFALAHAGFKDISITNRTFRRARELAEETGSKAVVLADAEAHLSDYDTIVQTTSVGMAEEALPLSLTHLGSGAVVADIIYNPLETPLLKGAKEKGCLTLNGVGMFVNQGAIAFEKWTGIRPDTEEMIQLITEKLGGYHVNR